jgi:hypothetical protein
VVRIHDASKQNPIHVTYITVELSNSDFLVAENDAVAVVFLIVVDGTGSHSGHCGGLDILGADFDLGGGLVERVGHDVGRVAAIPHIVPVGVTLTNLTGDLGRHLLVDLENN